MCARAPRAAATTRIDEINESISATMNSLPRVPRVVAVVESAEERAARQEAAAWAQDEADDARRADEVRREYNKRRTSKGAKHRKRGQFRKTAKLEEQLREAQAVSSNWHQRYVASEKDKWERFDRYSVESQQWVQCDLEARRALGASQQRVMQLEACGTAQDVTPTRALAGVYHDEAELRRSDVAREKRRHHAEVQMRAEAVENAAANRAADAAITEADLFFERPDSRDEREISVVLGEIIRAVEKGRKSFRLLSYVQL